MTKWLIRLFVKDAEQTENPDVRTRYGTLASVTGIVVNLLLAGAKFLMGLVTHSVAITADAANNLSDAAGSLVTFATVRLSNKPIDSDHPYGHGRMEYLGSLVVGALVLFMGITLLKDSIGAILHPSEILVTWVAIGVLVLSILGKLWLWRYYTTIGQKVNNGTLLAAAKDSLGDVLGTAASLIGMLLWHFAGIQADGWIGALVSLLILKAGWEVCRDTVDLLLGAKPDPEKVRQLREILLKQEGILGVHDLTMHDYGPGRCFASVHAEVDASGDMLEIHEMIDDVEREILHTMHIPTCIHMDPVVTSDPRLNAAKEALSTFLKNKDPRYSLHDFRMVPGEGHTNLIFDCVLPPECKDPDKRQLMRDMREFIKTIDETYFLVVQFDVLMVDE